MSQKKRSNKISIAERIVEAFDIPSSILPWGMDMEIRNDRDILVTGCTGIDEYSDKRVIFSGKGMRFVCDGADFELFTFADGRLKLSGCIENICIVRG